MRALIAEVGNNHFGSMRRAKQMIKDSKNSGADLVKLQAIDSNTTGSMPHSFYDHVQFSTEEYLELIEYGKYLGMPVFFSVISRKHKELYFNMPYFKVTGSMSSNLLTFHNFNGPKKHAPIAEFGFLKLNKPIFMSLPEGCLFLSVIYPKFYPLFVSAYLKADPKLHNLTYLKALTENDYGYSDHTVGTLAAEVAIKEFGCKIIEKHVCQKKEEKWGGVVFRDTIHGATMKELEKIAKCLKG